MIMFATTALFKMQIVRFYHKGLIVSTTKYAKLLIPKVNIKTVEY
jgi:hypothetical protein